MYKFQYKDKFACPAKTAFEGTTRDFEGLEKYIPNVTKIQVLEHEEKPGGVLRWMLYFHGDGAIPVVARAIVKPDMIRWKEELICNPNDMSIEWRIETKYFTEYFHCGGRTVYSDSASGCDMVVDGYLDVTLRHLPGFPDQLVVRAVRALEPFLGKFIAPNLGKFYQACKKRMKDRGQLSRI